MRPNGLAAKSRAQLILKRASVNRTSQHQFADIPLVGGRDQDHCQAGHDRGKTFRRSVFRRDGRTGYSLRSEPAATEANAGFVGENEMSPENRPSPPFVVIGAVAAGNAIAVMQDAIATLSALGAQPVSSHEGQNPVTLLSPDAGPLILKGTSDESAEPHAGVELWVSGDLLGGPSWIELEPDEIVERERIRRFVKAAFLAMCDRLGPIYAAIGVEWSVPMPKKLGTKSALLAGDLFWSRELDEVDPALAPDLATIYGSPGHAFSHGTLIQAGGILDAESPSPAQPLAAGRAAAKRLAHSLARLGS
jgi:hypothetical protein